jgi:GntR family transcriptional regulator
LDADTNHRSNPAQVVDRSSPLPVYFQVATDLRSRIERGEWSTGQRIAPELTLADEYDVSRVTVRQALAELVKDDLIEQRRGSGTYLRQQPRPLVYDLNLTVGALISRWRDSRFDNRARVIGVGVLDTPLEAVRLRLQVGRSEPVISMERLVFINERPAVIYRSWFSHALVPGLEASPRLGGSLSSVLSDDYGLSPTRSENELEVVRSTHEERALFQAARDVPLVLMTATSYLDSGRPLEHAQLAWLGDRIRFHVTAHTPQAPG